MHLPPYSHARAYTRTRYILQPPQVVRWFGVTKFRLGDWVGVELARPLGKNNGTVQWKKYFECESQHGIFVRPNNVEAYSDEAMATSAYGVLGRGDGGGGAIQSFQRRNMGKPCVGATGDDTPLEHAAARCLKNVIKVLAAVVLLLLILVGLLPTMVYLLPRSSRLPRLL
eukprot:g272.t1